MKSLLFSILLLTSLSASAAPQVSCFDLAFNHRNLVKDAAIALCKGATSNSPIACFDFSEQLNLPLRNRLMLCRGANENTISCFNLTASRNFTMDQAIELCSASK